MFDRWELALHSMEKLEELYQLESFRSWSLDVDDDLSGKSCTFETIFKIQKLIKLVKEDYHFLVQNNGLFFGEEHLSHEALITRYKEKEKMVNQYLLKNSHLK